MNFTRLLIILVLVGCGESFLRCRRPVKQPTNEIVVEERECQVTSDNLEDIHCSDADCKQRFRDMPIRINPFAQLYDTHVQPKPFASVCLKCAACLAISQQINRTLSKFHKSQKFGRKIVTFQHLLEFNDRQKDNLKRDLYLLCNRGFQNYGLRQYYGNRFLAPILPGTTHVTTLMDGEWTKKLQDLCKRYTIEFGEWELYEHFVLYTEHKKTLSDALCRSDGIFRECNNLDNFEYVVEANSIKPCKSENISSLSTTSTSPKCYFDPKSYH